MPDLISLIPSFCPGHVTVVSVVGQLSMVIPKEGTLFMISCMISNVEFSSLH